MTHFWWVFRRHWHPEVRWYARPRAVLLILSGHETEICGRCGGKVGLVWHVPDALWWKGSGFPSDAGVLCIACFEICARARGFSPYWEAANEVWPTCSGNPCAHEETVAIVAGHREDLWRELVDLRERAA